MEQILEKIRKLNWLLQKGGEGTIPFDDLCEILSAMMASEVYVISRKGKVLGKHYEIKDEPALTEDPDFGTEYILQKDNQKYMKLQETLMETEEIPDSSDGENTVRPRYRIVVPVFGGDRRLGTFIVSRYDKPYVTEDLIYSEYGAVIAGIDLERRMNLELEMSMRKRTSAQMALGTLTYTEIDAIKQVFEDMHSDEELVVPKKISEKYDVTESAIKSAIKKLDSFGVIEARSIGMKGSRIRIVNEMFRDELSKIDI